MSLRLPFVNTVANIALTDKFSTHNVLDFGQFSPNIDSTHAQSVNTVANVALADKFHTTSSILDNFP